MSADLSDFAQPQGGAAGRAGRDADFWLRLAGALFTVVLPACFLGQGPVRDDARHLLLLRRYEELRTWDLFDIASRGHQGGDPAWAGVLPWWADPEYKLRFFRPITNALAHAEHALFQPHFVVFKLTALIIALAGQWLAQRLFDRLLPRRTASVAGLLFGVHVAHAFGTIWWAARHVLLAGVLTLCAFHLHVLAGDKGADRRWRAASLGAMLLALLSSESAIAGLALFLAFEAVRPVRLGERVAAALPPLVLGALVQVIGRLNGSGTFGSDLYIDPLRDPGGWLQEAPGRFAVFTGALLHGPPADLWRFGMSTALMFGVAGSAVALLVAMGVGLRSRLEAAERSGVRFFALAAVLALVPITIAPLTNRVLYLPSFPVCALLAIVVAGALRAGRAFRVAGGVLLAAQVVLALVWWGTTYRFFGKHEKAMIERSDVLIRSGVGGAERVVFLHADPATRIIPLFAELRSGAVQPRWEIVTMVPGRVSVRRRDATTLELRALDADFFSSPYERLFYRREPPKEVRREPFSFEWSSESPRVLVMRVGPAPAFDAMRFFDDAPDALKEVTLPPHGGELILGAAPR